jgi:hypothetical protein
MTVLQDSQPGGALAFALSTSVTSIDPPLVASIQDLNRPRPPKIIPRPIDEGFDLFPNVGDVADRVAPWLVDQAEAGSDEDCFYR